MSSFEKPLLRTGVAERLQMQNNMIRLQIGYNHLRRSSGMSLLRTGATERLQAQNYCFHDKLIDRSAILWGCPPLQAQNKHFHNKIMNRNALFWGDLLGSHSWGQSGGAGTVKFKMSISMIELWIQKQVFENVAREVIIEDRRSGSPPGSKYAFAW